jgi:hypothetical protein
VETALKGVFFFPHAYGVFTDEALAMSQTFTPVANYMNKKTVVDKHRKSSWPQTEVECSDWQC